MWTAVSDGVCLHDDLQVSYHLCYLAWCSGRYVVLEDTSYVNLCNVLQQFILFSMFAQMLSVSRW